MKFLHPRYWLIWLGMGVLRLISWLPWRVQMVIGEYLGKIFHALLKKRRRICCINLQLAFPELSSAEREQLNRRHFSSLAKGFFEASMSWWGRERTLRPLLKMEGEEYLDQALKQGKGILLLSAHFTSLEIGGRLLAMVRPEVDFHVVYRPHQNPLIEHIVANIRARRYGKAIPKDNIRDMIKSLKQGFPLWYAQDQSYRGKNSVVVPFFGIATSTNSATSRFAKMSGASVIPFFTVRTGNSGYLLKFLPPMDNFPGENVEQDTTRINHIIETQVREFPEQYLWTHKRFKHHGEDFYENFSGQQPETECE